MLHWARENPHLRRAPTEFVPGLRKAAARGDRSGRYIAKGFDKGRALVRLPMSKLWNKFYSENDWPPARTEDAASI